MDVNKLKECLNSYGCEELGIPIITESITSHLHSIISWSLEGTPQQGRQIWFSASNYKEIRYNFQANVRCRILPISIDQLFGWIKRGPCEALLIPQHGFIYSDPNFILNEFWKKRGIYIKTIEFIENTFNYSLWIWKPLAKPLKFFGMCHHHAVLWDMKQILRPLGVHIDFTWLSDGREAINEAIPFHIQPQFESFPFNSSLDIYKTDIHKPLDPEFKKMFLTKGYDGIITSHSIITAFRLKELGLPMIHVNSTRFGNEWIQDFNGKHTVLCDEIQTLLRENKLSVIHNNRGDKTYFNSFFSVEPQQDVYIPSLCEAVQRLRIRTPLSPKFLIWDTRQILLQKDKSPFMKTMFNELVSKYKDGVESQAILLAKKGGLLEEGFLDDYTAVIHIPYNISTMSIFQQTRNNIPIWVPSAKLLETLWTSMEEPNELSWTMFSPGSEANVDILDKVRDPNVVKHWVSKADFYNKDTMGCVLEFDSIEDLVLRLGTVDYSALMAESELNQEKRREEIFAGWEGVLRKFQ